MSYNVTEHVSYNTMNILCAGQEGEGIHENIKDTALVRAFSKRFWLVHSSMDSRARILGIALAFLPPQ